MRDALIAWRGVVLVLATIGALVYLAAHVRIDPLNQGVILMVVGSLCTLLGNLVVRSRDAATADVLRGLSMPPPNGGGGLRIVVPRVPPPPSIPPIDTHGAEKDDDERDGPDVAPEVHVNGEAPA